MNDLRLGLSASQLPQHRRVTAGVYALALLFHITLFAVLIWASRARFVRVVPGDAMSTGIAAYVTGSVGTAGATPETAAREQPKKPAPTRAAKAAPSQDDGADTGQTAGSQGAAGSGAGSGPVRLGSGGNLTLLNKVQPIYPRQLESARIPGTVVLDAVIRRDGTIGDVTVLKSSNNAFAQAAVTAVKQWRYTPLPYEGILTVTVNFTVP